MKRNVFLVCVAIGIVTAIGLAGDQPPVFSRLSLDEAKAAAVKDKRLLVVKATAAWCGPCKRMDKTTWVDPSVVEWITANAIAVQFDVDEQKELAKSMSISSMPTMIAFRDGVEFDRASGYMDGPRLLAWMKGVQAGKKAADTVKELAKEETSAGVQARLDLARMLVEDKKYEEAAEHYVWLWNNMLRFSPSMSGVRVSFMVGDMGRLLEHYEAARPKFTALRDAEALKLADPKGKGDRGDWIVLNEMLGEDARTLEWFDATKDDRKARTDAYAQAGYTLEGLLLRHDRWADFGRLFPAPVQKVKELVARRRMNLRIEDAGEDEWANKHFREEIAQLYAGMLAADRGAQAARVLQEAEKEDASPELKAACVEMALEAEEVLPEHAEWLRPIKDSVDGADVLLDDVEAALLKRSQTHP
jgi:thiol-disulfide isomerase/thioredoxin